MYAQHQPQIAEYAHRGPRELANVARFVLATIRCPFPDAIAAYHQLVRTGSQASPIAFFGSKLDGLDWLDVHSVTLWQAVQACRGDRNALVATFAIIPGIGLVKAGFLAQLTHGVSGCIDTHNLQRFGKSYGDVKYNKKAHPATRLRRVTYYNQVVDELGGTEKLWNDWCAYVGKAQGYGSAEEVSAMHLQVII